MLKVAGLPPILKKSQPQRTQMSLANSSGIKVIFKDLENNTTLSFQNIKTAGRALGIGHTVIRKYITSTGTRFGLSPDHSPLLGRYILLSVGVGLRKPNMSVGSSKSILVTDLTLGLKNKVLYPSLAAFARSIRSDANNVARALRKRQVVFREEA